MNSHRELSEAFLQRFGRAPEVGARAPGRVNLIGEHTDYSQGLVLPCAIDRETHVLAAPRADGRFRVWARDLDEEGEFEVADLRRRGGWIDYVQAIVFALVERGHGVHGLDLAVASSVPRESGLSSSAALGVAVAAAIDAAQGHGLDALKWAQLAHRGESQFVGVGCGILDQFASALGRRDHALRIDCRTQQVDAVPLPPLSLLIAHSGITRALAHGDYRARVDECAAALTAARDAGAVQGASSLRDFASTDLSRLKRVLEPRLFRRVRHVITENDRVDACCQALRGGDLSLVGRLLEEGQASLRDDFEVSTPELDFLCEASHAIPGVYGSRLTGAGFGGCTLHLVRREAAAAAGELLAARFEARFGRRLPVLEVRAAQGASFLPL